MLWDFDQLLVGKSELQFQEAVQLLQVIPVDGSQAMLDALCGKDF